MQNDLNPIFLELCCWCTCIAELARLNITAVHGFCRVCGVAPQSPVSIQISAEVFFLSDTIFVFVWCLTCPFLASVSALCLTYGSSIVLAFRAGKTIYVLQAGASFKAFKWESIEVLMLLFDTSSRFDQKINKDHIDKPHRREKTATLIVFMQTKHSI